jgi:phage shock protein PspC (stress-responsive transcriptional regulator)
MVASRAKQRWHRADGGRIVLGVLGGTAQALGTGPAVVRVIFLCAMFVLPMPMFVAYAIAALILPGEDGASLLEPDSRDRAGRALGWLGAGASVLLVSGAGYGRAPLLFAYTAPAALAVIAVVLAAVGLSGLLRARRPG